ncbi:MAG: FtsX-like permease family protein, partial [Dehalococcoidia bacterium]
NRGLQIDLGIGTDVGVRGAIRSGSDTVPIVFSQTALDANNLAVGDESVMHAFGRSIPIRVVGVTELFPTLDPDSGGFAVMDVEQLWDHLALSSANSAGVAAEIFVGLDDMDDTVATGAVSSMIGGLHSVVARDEIQRSSVVTPLAVAGWRGASIVTATLAIALAVLGFLTFAPMRPAGDHFNLAVLRSLGVRKRGLVMMSVIEQVVVLVVGVAAGIGTGLFMARYAVDTASQTDSNVNSLPPMVFSTNWNFIGALVVALAAVAIVILVADIVSVRRINVAETVRTLGKSG